MTKGGRRGDIVSEHQRTRVSDLQGCRGSAVARGGAPDSRAIAPLFPVGQ
jgi:hypothetical protein